MQNNNMKNWFQLGTPQGGIAFGIIGIIVALAFLTLGFWGTLLVVALFVLGYAVGAYGKKPEAEAPKAEAPAAEAPKAETAKEQE